MARDIVHNFLDTQTVMHLGGQESKGYQRSQADCVDEVNAASKCTRYKRLAVMS